ncbi:maleylpyruvate isomerase N-terminal domain-containing protein [Streptomyces sp. CHA1]|uniref:maleylpyruvate isomerase N-terminal domain-containing protein n=1 Tax=unclassified Streptomyces TaxID=2593676 RepID=UPI001BFC8B99|nr:MULTISPECIES: maleylpyruvate isomerase N-terminal domain-containing protein [unclassified Streptomyces]MBT3160932.1 maleylpyruvate isomerase N-terminal domain-containing protein [Streptomyces sp. G11C]MCO6701177.1 maleylpyruvate isomerase N-terminal domain-containing protein [Streptomyces sp. CHB9.2]MCO6707433.1 maleylpyruvate isomerase N-terminal domain-containing protein [Streptomyces sp. CHA3]MCO6713170.1 maleylpyruvate isomerase N-terminal domain-containing protein [Streptomyces sp. CHB1
MTTARLDVDHRALMSYLGAWALSACSPEEAAAVESHLPECARCAEEARRLRDAVGLLHHEEPLDLDPGLRARVLESCLDRRPPKIPVPEWAAAYDTETARLDALLQDIQDAEWHAPVRLRWFEGEEQVGRRTTVAGVIGHLMTVDGLVAVALGLEDPLGARTPAHLVAPDARTEALWNASPLPQTRSVRRPWREQSHRLVSALSLESDRSAALDVAYGGYALPLRDSLLDRAFECWVHAEDIAGAVDYPYDPPKPRHLNGMIDLAARMLPGVIGQRRRAGLGRGAPEPGGVLHLEIEGAGGGDWYIGLDGEAGEAAAESGRAVAHVALDGVEFCRLAAGHVRPREAAAGQDGDMDAVHEVLFAAASLSRM